mgnify:CR=1 FL=1
MDEVVKIVNDIKAGNIKPIYFLMGEEPYYIDKLSDFIEQNVLSEEEKGGENSYYAQHPPTPSSPTTFKDWQMRMVK